MLILIILNNYIKHKKIFKYIYIYNSTLVENFGDKISQ